MVSLFKGRLTSFKSTLKSRGQSSILGIAFGGMLMIGIYTMYNVGQVTNEKTRLVHATDAAAYSSGIHVARNLNYVAYSNRAMIANHIVIGHLTAYYSWVHYAEEMVGVIDDICDALCNFIPYIGTLINQYVNIAEEIIEVAVDLAEDGSEYIARTSDILNDLYYLGQIGAHEALGPHRLNSLQDEVLQAYDTNISRHSGGAAISGNAKLQIASARTITDAASILTYLEFDAYTPGNDDGRIKNLVELTTGHMMNNDRSDRWLTLGEPNRSRDWRVRFGIPGALEFRLEKRGNTQHLEADGDGGDTEGLVWDTDDSFRARRRSFGGKWRTFASTSKHEANTRDDIYDDYQGIANYKAESEDLDDCYQPAITARGLAGNYDCHSVTVVARKNLSNARMMAPGDGDHAQSGASLYSVARAEIFFNRPDQSYTDFRPFSGSRVEYANVFNPFWRARLSD